MTGETERALRRATCAWCWEGLPLSEHPKEDSPVHIAPPHGYLRVERRYKCTSKHAELLPLFNAGIVGAYAAAAKEAGFRVRFLITGTPDEQAAHMESCILALTPADARLAQQQIRIAAALEQQTACAKYIASGGDENYAITDLDNERVGMADELAEKILNLPLRPELQTSLAALIQEAKDVAKDELSAAIASAEARARLAEDALTTAMPYIEFYAKREMESPSNGQEAVRETREMLHKCRAAARTPDSTKEPE